MSAHEANRLLLVTRKKQGRARFSLVDATATQGLRLVEERDPGRALGRYARERFDAVALDLPCGEALEFAADLRQAHPTAIIILLVPADDLEFKRRALRSGVNAVVPGRGPSRARRSLLETTLQTLRLAALNCKLAAETHAAARGLEAVVREFKSRRAERERARRGHEALDP